MLRALRTGAVVVLSERSILRIEGPGALQCLQGLLTSDLEKPGPGSLVYGALLTSKGMIVFDAWVLRDHQGFTLVIERKAHTAALELFRKTLPPRLARVTDLSAEFRVCWFLGEDSLHRLHAAEMGLVPAEPGRIATKEFDDHKIQFAVAPDEAPFRALGVGDSAGITGVIDRVMAAGSCHGEENEFDAARILAGWPRLGAEIDERTLPQEVRFDSIGGVSYTKGCYTGQETVARVHFRGHPNRVLRGLIWTDLNRSAHQEVVASGKPVGSIRSELRLPDRRIALAVLRREIEIGVSVAAGGGMAEVVELPFSVEQVEE